MKEYTHFDLEDAIFKVWQTVDDIETLYKYHGDVEKPMTEDEIGNALLGLKQLHEMRCWQLMDMSARVFKLNQYCTDPEKLAAREALFGLAIPNLDLDVKINKPKKGNKK